MPENDGRRQGAGPKQGASDFVQLVIDYVRQETVDPVVRQLKALGKGVIGGALVAIGTVLLGLGFLRALQTELGGARGDVNAPGVALVQVGGQRLAVPMSKVAHFNAFGSAGHLSGDWSWVPYMGAALFCLAVAGFCVMRITRGSAR
jgi:hypothetical protein